MDLELIGASEPEKIWAVFTVTINRPEQRWLGVRMFLGLAWKMVWLPASLMPK